MDAASKSGSPFSGDFGFNEWVGSSGKIFIIVCMLSVHDAMFTAVMRPNAYDVSGDSMLCVLDIALNTERMCALDDGTRTVRACA